MNMSEAPVTVKIRCPKCGAEYTKKVGENKECPNCKGK